MTDAGQEHALARRYLDPATAEAGGRLMEVNERMRAIWSESAFTRVLPAAIPNHGSEALVRDALLASAAVGKGECLGGRLRR